MSALVVTAIFMVVTLISLTVQSVAVIKLHRRRALISTSRQYLVHRRLYRTVVCRALAALLYLCVGIYSMTIGPNPVVSIGLFTAVQLLWQANSLADLKLRRQLAQESDT